GDQRHQGGAGGDPEGALEEPGAVRRGGRRGGGLLGGAQQQLEVAVARAGGQLDRPLLAAGDHAHEIPVLLREEADHAGREDHRVALGAAVGGGGRHRGGGVGDDREVPHPLLVELADQRFAGAGGGLPVDVGDLVPGLVVLQVVEVLAAALEQGA